MTTTVQTCPECAHPEAHSPLIGCLHRTADGGYCPCTVEWEPTPLPVTPYAGTSGWSGTATSRERAERDDADGTTRDRQQAVLDVLADQGPRGITWKELADALGWHHGQASGALSVLHKDARIARLAVSVERRDRCAVYVLPEHVNGRETTVQGRKPKDLPSREALAAVLLAHQRRDIARCTCGWSDLGHSFPGHQADMVLAMMRKEA